MIVAGPEGFRKNQYRKFNIKSENLTPGDDFGMMREVLTRRFKRLLSEAPRAPLVRPPPEGGGRMTKPSGRGSHDARPLPALRADPPQGRGSGARGDDEDEPTPPGPISS